LLLGLLPAILIASILYIALLQIGISGGWLGMGLNSIFNAIIDLVAWISSFDVLVLKDLYLKPVDVVLWYVILLCVALFFRPQLLKSKRERLRVLKPNNFLHFGMVAGILLVLSGVVESLTTEESFLVLHQSRGTAIAVSNGAEAKLLTHIPDMNTDRREQSLNRLKNISPFLNQKIAVDSLNSQLSYADHKIVIIDESGIYLDSKQVNPVVLLSHSPKINLDQLITRLNPKLIISDGSNYRNVVNRWEKTCAVRNVKFINTYEYGAVNVLEY
jgi:competence protein ComEC